MADETQDITDEELDFLTDPTNEVEQESGENEMTTAEKVAAAEAQEESVEEVVEEAPVQVVEEESVEEVVEEAPVQELNELEAFLSRYINDMAPRVPIPIGVGASNQYSLWKTIEAAITSTDKKEFKKQWNTLLKYFDEYKDGAFGPRYVYRFSEYWRWSESDLAVFQKLINLMILTANPATRTEGLRQIDLSIMMKEGFTDTMSQNISIYYQG